MKKKTKFVVFLILFSVVLSICAWGYMIKSAGYTIKSMDLEYIAGVAPKENETLENVTVYLPFPLYKGEPAIEIFEEIKRDFEEYDKRDFPGMTLKIADTKYGPMLKVYIPKLDKGYGIGAHLTKPISIFSRVEPTRDYVLESRFKMGESPEVVENDKIHDRHIKKGYSRIFLDYKGGTGIIFRQKFEVSSTTHYFISLYAGAFKGYIVGLDELPRGAKTAFVISTEVSEKGWIEVPIIEY